MNFVDGPPQQTIRRGSELTPEQIETASLLERVLGKAIADRFTDFCNLSTGNYNLRVSSPIAAHAIRELESILRQALVPVFPVTAPASEGEDTRLKLISQALGDYGFDGEQIERAIEELRPQTSHRNQIVSISVALGLAEDSDIAKKWISISGAAGKAHERKPGRSLVVDDDFCERWSEPFHVVIRGIAVQLQGKYTLFMRRIVALAAMPERGKAVALFVSEAQSAALQWHFYRSIQGVGWLPSLRQHKLLVEPPPYSSDESDEPGLRKWPIGIYLFGVVKTGDEAARRSIVVALRSLANSKSVHRNKLLNGLLWAPFWLRWVGRIHLPIVVQNNEEGGDFGLDLGPVRAHSCRKRSFELCFASA